MNIPMVKADASVMRWRSLAALVFSVGISQSSTAGGQLPKEITSHISEMNDLCSDVGGKPHLSGNWEGSEDHTEFRAQSLVEHGILARGRVEVWVVDEGRYQCDKAAGLFSGSGGAQVYVFARVRDGSVKQVFTQGAYGAEMRRTGQLSELTLGVGGSLCGQFGDFDPGDAIYCTRPLAWDPSAQEMDFAPLSEAKFGSNEAARK